MKVEVALLPAQLAGKRVPAGWEEEKFKLLEQQVDTDRKVVSSGNRSVCFAVSSSSVSSLVGGRVLMGLLDPVAQCIPDSPNRDPWAGIRAVMGRCLSLFSSFFSG